MSRIDYLDGWRGIAIALVLFSHFIGSTQINTGRLGVDIFFSLSGMLMGNILFIKSTPLTTFYKRRVSRILPAFLLYTLAAFFVAVNVGVTIDSAEILSTLLFMRTYFPSEINIWNSPISIAHLWSLNVEEHAYIIMSIMTLSLARKRGAATLMVLAILAQIVFIFYVRHPNFSPENPEIRTETAIAYIFYSAALSVIGESTTGKKMMIGGLGIFAFIASVASYANGSPWYFQLAAPFALAYSVNTLKYMPRRILQALSFKPLRMLGLWSYSIYLWQQLFHDYKASLTPSIAFCGAIITGIFSFYLFEQPIRSFLNEKIQT